MMFIFYNSFLSSNQYNNKFWLGVSTGRVCAQPGLDPNGAGE